MVGVIAPIPMLFKGQLYLEIEGTFQSLQHYPNLQPSFFAVTSEVEDPENSSKDGLIAANTWTFNSTTGDGQEHVFYVYLIFLPQHYSDMSQILCLDSNINVNSHQICYKAAAHCK